MTDPEAPGQGRRPLSSRHVCLLAAFGAALLAGVGAGVYASAEEATQAVITITGRTEPSAQSTIYGEYYTLYRELYPALSQTFAGLAAASH